MFSPYTFSNRQQNTLRVVFNNREYFCIWDVIAKFVEWHVTALYALNQVTPTCALSECGSKDWVALFPPPHH